MQYRNIGDSDLRVSLLGLGGNNFGHRMDLPATTAVVHKALDLGITLFDTADVYGGAERYGDGGRSEEFLGQALAGRRRDVVIATKFGLPMTNDARPVNGTRAYMFEAVEASLKRLNTDYIDLYQLHKWDPETPITETLEALEELVKQGKVRYAGSSNFTGEQVNQARAVARAAKTTGFIACQEQYSLLSRQVEDALIPAIHAGGQGLIPFFPLASGMLTGKYIADGATGRLTKSKHHAERFVNDNNLELTKKFDAFARSKNHSLLELAFGWLAARPTVSSIIAGASSPAQLETNAAAFGWVLSEAELHEVDAIAGRKSLDLHA
jgi:aryl-alcohol dehydrogenase-like predicted oxidoreductase